MEPVVNVVRKAWAKYREDTRQTNELYRQQQAKDKAARDADRERQAEMAVKMKKARTFPALKVQVYQGEVYTLGRWLGGYDNRNDSQLLGPLAGTEVKLSNSVRSWSPGKAMVTPIAFTPLATKEVAQAFIIFADGKMQTTELNGSRAVLDAQREALEFAALVNAAE